MIEQEYVDSIFIFGDRYKIYDYDTGYSNELRDLSIKKLKQFLLKQSTREDEKELILKIIMRRRIKKIKKLKRLIK